MVVILGLAFMGIVVSACGMDDPDLTFMSVPTTSSTSRSASIQTLESSQCSTVDLDETATRLHLQPDGFMPPDPVVGVGCVLEAQLQGSILQLEVARTQSERARGLMERASLPEDAAMLFVYEGEAYLSFWMKNTLIPLDILFLDAQGVVVDVQTMHTQIGDIDSALKRYRSAGLARFALEMNVGLAETLGIVRGTQILFR